MDVSRDGQTIVGGDASGHVHLWSTATGQRQDAPVAFDEPGTMISAVAFDPSSPDGDRVAVATERGVKLWSRSSAGTPIVLSDTNVEALAYDPHGAHLAVVEDGGIVKVWTTGRKSPLTMTAHGGRAGFPAFNSDGSLLAMGTAEGIIEVRNVASGRTVMLSRVHGDSVNDVAFMPDDSHIVSTSDDTNVTRSPCEACTNDAAVIEEAQRWAKQRP
jgi:WD40 repeat protein